MLEGACTALLHRVACLCILLHGMQSAPELRVEAVDYIQQDVTGQPVNQTAETLAVLFDTTTGAAEIQAAKTIIKQVPTSQNALARKSPWLLLTMCKPGSSLGRVRVSPLRDPFDSPV